MRILAIAVAFLLSSSASAATTFFVSPAGNDANPGTEAAPWRTIARALQSVAAGDTVLLREGTWNERVIVHGSGAPGARITFAAYGAETATIDGTGIAIDEDGGLFEIVDASHITVRGLRLVRSSGAGVYVDRSTDVTVEAVRTYDTVSSGIGVWSSRDITITDCEVELACNDGAQECITVAGTERFEVHGNHVHHGGPGTNGGEGIDVKDGSSHGSVHHNEVHDLERLGIYVEAWDKYTHDVDVYCNLVRDTHNDGITLASEMGGLLQRVRVFDNISRGNRFVGISLGAAGDAPVHPLQDIEVVNNTIVGNGVGEWGGGISIDADVVSGIVVRNNIVSGNLSFQVAVASHVDRNALTIDHNLIDGYRGDPDEITGSAFVEGSPRFLDAGAYDFRLAADSPAIDAGSPAGAPSFDYDGRARPGGLGIDIGAFERIPPRRRAARHAPDTYYVRTDGGSAEQCTGLADAPYPGSGVAQACAWDHPFRALPPHRTPRVASGDTLIIRAGSYMIGLGAPETSECEPFAAFDCVMPPVPSGVRIVGDCSAPPELWGTERVAQVIDLTGSNDVELACMEITDHSGCVESHSGSVACERDDPPFGPWAARGIYAQDSARVVLRDLDIHGLAAAGVHAGRLADWTVQDVRIAANGWVGWDGDIDGDDANTGVLRFTRWTVEWNGCGETYPEEQPYQCWAQTAGGYGDGVGTGDTTGRWIIEESAFLHNTSDGLDLLYGRPGSSIEIRRTIAAGNAGNQIKTTGPVTIENTVVVGNCGFFDANPLTHHVDNCRGAGGAVALFAYRGDRVRVTNSTIAGEGDCLALAGCREGGGCDGSEDFVFRNNLFYGVKEFLDPTDRPCFIYVQDVPQSVVDADYSLIDGVKVDGCPGTHDLCGVPAGVLGTSIDAFDGRLLATSLAIDRGTTTNAPAVDFTGAPRDERPDIGAYEFRRAPARRRAIRH